MARKILPGIFLTIAFLAIIFIGLELVLRWRGAFSSDFYRFDAKTGLQLFKSNSEFKEKNSCYETKIKTNSQGFHDSEFTLEKPKDVFRIAIFGDSFVQSRQVPVEKSFHYILEQKLNRAIAGQKFEVLAFGIGGNGTFKNYLYLNQYGLKYKPDLVILGFLPANDFRDDYEIRKRIFDKEGNIRKETPAFQKIISKSVLLGWFNYKWRLVKTNLNLYFNKKKLDRVPFDFQVFLKEYPPGWQTIWDIEEKLISEFKKAVEAQKSKFFLVSFDDIWRSQQEHLPREGYGKYLDSPELDFEKPEKILGEFAKKEQIPYLALAPIIKDKVKKTGEMNFYYPCDAHWNELGNQWAAQELFEFLTNNQKLITDNQ